MMKSLSKILFLSLTGLFCTMIVPAQELPVLTPDKAISSGTLPNGTNFYIVANPSVKGLVDFALVQKTGTENINDTDSYRAVSEARKTLSSGFFTSHGATLGKDGFVKVKDNSTEFRFSNILISKPEVLDSALFSIITMVDRITDSEDEFVRKWYSPSDQAVIVAGDVDPSKVAEKLKMLSYMTPAFPSSDRKEYVWEEKGAGYLMQQDETRELASLTATWSSARTPKAYMHTIQPAIYDLYLTELGMVSREYISKALKSKGIPFAEVSAAHTTSLQTSGDEAFTVSVHVAPKDFEEMVRTVSEVMGGIDAGKTDVNDLARIKHMCMDQARDLSMEPVFTNSEYVDRCIMAFMYNGSLSTMKTKVDFLAGRHLADTTELRLFNNIASAVLDSQKNLDVSYVSSMTEDKVRNLFESSWTSEAQLPAPSKVYTRDDFFHHVEYDAKVKIKTEKSDHMSKGKEWTFSNGFKVVFKSMPTGGRIYYNLALNGGFGSVEGLAKGEGGYVSDYFMLSRIYDIPAEDFMGLMASEGMSMDVHVGLNAMMISGSADKEKPDFMLKSLLAVMNGRKRDDAAVRYYESGEGVRHQMRKGTSVEMVAKVNDLMCPDYTHVSYRMLETLSPSLSDKAEKFFMNQMAKTNDGVLIIVGDISEDVLKKELLDHVGGFIVTDRAFRRSLVRYQPSSGWSTYTVEGKENSVDIALSVPFALTADNFMAAEIASMVLKKMLSDAVAETGMCVSLSHECRVYPNERVNFHISLNEVSPDGFEADIVHSDPMEALAKVRTVLSGVGGADVKKEDVEAFKAQLKDILNMEMKVPFYWLNVISRRHLAGKDFTTNHENRIASVNVDKVKAILSAMNDGTRVEYIVSKK